MDNRQIADNFDLIADLLEIRGDVIYKILAYRRAAESLRELGQDVSQIHEKGQLQDIPGVGEAISDKIQELLETGALTFLEELKAEVPPSLVELLQVPGLGPKRVGQFWRELDITTLDELQSAAESQKLRGLDGIGPKTEENILSGVASLKKRTSRIRLGDALPFAEKVLHRLRALPQVEAAEAGGSLRRMRETVGDLDLLAASEDPKSVMETFLNDPEVVEIVSRGDVKSSVVYKGGLRAQLWVHPPARFGTALQYATGAADHNVRLRELALDQGYSLSEHALLRVEDDTELLFDDEKDLYEKLGLPWIPPELREDRGEIQAAKEGKLPVLIKQEDIISELHSHSTWSDGRFSIKEMALGAIQRGYQILAITDHSQSLGIAGGLSADELKRQRDEIHKVQEELGDQISLLQGVEMEILADGALDFPDQVLAELDIVVASLHTSMRQPREKATARLLNAIHNPYVDIIGHPTNRLIGRRDPADVDMDAVLEAAAAQGTALEINANPMRLDLSDIYVRRAIQLDIPISINTDAHSPDEMDYLVFGVATARRGWASAENVINAWPVETLLDWLERNK
ncbi:MAG: DNA polymerase/3'-5' exonuclease PolX [Anaerolineales bacterium]